MLLSTPHVEKILQIGEWLSFRCLSWNRVLIDEYIKVSYAYLAIHFVLFYEGKCGMI